MKGSGKAAGVVGGGEHEDVQVHGEPGVAVKGDGVASADGVGNLVAVEELESETSVTIVNAGDQVQKHPGVTVLEAASKRIEALVVPLTTVWVVLLTRVWVDPLSMVLEALAIRASEVHATAVLEEGEIVLLFVAVDEAQVTKRSF